MTEGGPSGDSWQDEKGEWHRGPPPDASGSEAPPPAARPPLPPPPETGTGTGGPPPPPPPPAPPGPRRRRVWPWIVALVAAFIVGIALGAAGQTTETLTSTSSTTTTIEADPATVTTTRIRTKVRLRPPPSSGVKVSYGDWEGIFRIVGANISSESFGSTVTAKVVGQFEYLGGGDCGRLGYVEVQGTFFDSSGRIVGTGLWNSTTAPEGVRIPMEVSSIDVSSVPSRAEIVVTGAGCD